MISHVVVGIYKDSRRQIERDFLDLDPFRNGLMLAKYLKAKEIFSQIYCVFLALSNSYLVKDIFKKKRKKSDNAVNMPLLSKGFLIGYLSVVESLYYFTYD